MFIKMRVAGLTIDPFTNMPIVILKDSDDKETIPIWIGLVEASAIATELENIELARPMTHDLIKNMLTQLDVIVDRVEINELRENTYYASIFLKKGKESFENDSRPSDAIALALRTNADIQVAKKVIEKSRNIDLRESQEDKDKWTELLENMSNDDFGKYKM